MHHRTGLQIWISFAATLVVGASVSLAEALPFTVRSGVRFLTPDTAQLCWETNVPGKGSVAFGISRKLGTVVHSQSVGDRHTVILKGLQPGTQYHYRIAVDSVEKRLFSPFYEFDTRMNYAVPMSPQPNDPKTEVQPILDALNHPGGVAVVACDEHDSWTTTLTAASSLTVIGAFADEQAVQAQRKRWSMKDGYGIRFSAQLIEHLPSEFANLVITDAKRCETLANCLSPLGTLVCVDKPPESSQWTWTSHQDRLWIGSRTEKRNLTEWNHQYGSPASGSFAGEDLDGVDSTEALEVRWLGRPGADFGIDRNPRMPAPLAVNGRLYHQGMNRMIALDAFNGSVLWSLEIPDLRRVNIPRDCGNWCADQSFVYAVTRDRIWKIDGATGEMKSTVSMPADFESGFEWGYVAATEDRLIATTVKSGSAFEDYWAKTSWYDGKDESTTAKVCGSAIISIDKKYGDVKWQRPVDAVVHSTIAISGNHVYFVEGTSAELKKLSTGRLSNEQIWKDAKVVCLDLESGKEKWQQPLPGQANSQIVAFGLADEDQFIFQSSAENKFQFMAFDSQTGESKWDQEVSWPSDNHGAHMQHAVLMNGNIYVQPHIIDATTGNVLKSGTLGKRRGCATPIGAGNTIIYRGGTGPLSLWSLDKDQPSEFSRLRPSCWLSTIPAQGMLFSPEAGGGCSCGGWMECSIGFAPIRSLESQE